MSKKADPKEVVASVDVDEVNMDALIPYNSCCCFIESIYTDTVNCWGCTTGGQLLFFAAPGGFDALDCNEAVQ